MGLIAVYGDTFCLFLIPQTEVSFQRFQIWVSPGDIFRRPPFESDPGLTSQILWMDGRMVGQQSRRARVRARVLGQEQETLHC